MIQRVCPTCGSIGCKKHKRKAWQGSDRRTKTRSGWAQQRRARWVLAEYDGVCHVCNQHGAEEVDHVIPLAESGSDDIENMRPIHAECHKEKTQGEAQRARVR